MANWTQLNAANPATVAATEEKVYNKYWMSHFEVKGDSPTKPMKMRVVFIPCRDVTVGELTYKELQPNGEVKVVLLEDLFGAAESDPEIAELINGILSKIQEIGAADGIFDTISSSSSGA